jgi:hypothetical protein
MLGALPPMKVTRELAEVEAFFAGEKNFSTTVHPRRECG